MLFKTETQGEEWELMFEKCFVLFVLSIKIFKFATIKALCLKERLTTFFTNTININFMKKFYSLFILFALVVSANAQQQEPVITLTYTVDGTEPVSYTHLTLPTN